MSPYKVCAHCGQWINTGHSFVVLVVDGERLLYHLSTPCRKAFEEMSELKEKAVCARSEVK